MADFSSQQAIDLANVPAYLLAETGRPTVERLQVSHIFQQLCRHLLHRQHMIHQTRRKGAPKNGIVLGGVKGLGHRHSAALFNLAQAERAVRAGAR